MAKTAKKTKAELTKDLSPVEKERWDSQHTIEYIARIYSGGEHLRAAALAAEAQFGEKDMEDLKILAPGIVDHMPAEPGDVKDKGSVQGDPVREEMQRYQIDESEVQDLATQREESLDPKAVEAKREAKPAGKPEGSPKDDGLDLHRQTASNKGTQDTETTKK